MTLLSPPPGAPALSDQLRAITLAHIAERGLEASEVAELLGVLPSTAATLLVRAHWDIGLAVSVVDRLKVDVHLDRIRGEVEHTSGIADASRACDVCGFSLWIPLATLSVTAVGLYDDARFPGRCIVALRRHEEQFEDVSASLMSQATSELKVVSRAIKRVTGAGRLNYALLGNTEKHVHWHVIPRFPEQEELPGRSPWDDPRPRATMSEQQRAEVESSLIAAITTSAQGG